MRDSRGTQKIIASVLSRVEVAYLKMEEVDIDLTDDAMDKINDFFADDSVIEVAGLNDIVAEMARDLIVQAKRAGERIKNFDAVQLATAQWMDVAVFHTYNLKDFSFFNPFMPFDIKEPEAIQGRFW